MKRFINIALGLTLIVTHMTIELYPALKMGTKIYINKLDFNTLSNTEPVAKFAAYLSNEEKGELVNMIIDYSNNILD